MSEGTGPDARRPRRPPRPLAVVVATLAALAVFLAGWQVAWRWGPYAAACFSIAAAAGLLTALAIVAVTRCGPWAGER